MEESWDIALEAESSLMILSIEIGRIHSRRVKGEEHPDQTVYTVGGRRLNFDWDTRIPYEEL